MDLDLDFDLVLSKSRGIVYSKKINDIYSWTFYPKKNRLYITKREYIKEKNKNNFIRVMEINNFITKKTTTKSFLELVLSNYGKIAQCEK